MVQKRFPLFLALLVSLCITGTARADSFGPIDLGPASSYTVLGISSLILSQGNVTGNVGIGGGNQALLKSNLNGQLFVAAGATPVFHDDYIINGNPASPTPTATNPEIHYNLNLSSAINAAEA